MKVLLLDVDSISYELVEPEASVYEDSDERSFSANDALVMMLSVEKGDNDSIAGAALADAFKAMRNLGRKRLVIYPFAHLSGNLEEPKAAMGIINHMRESASSENGMEVVGAPFGWNKKWSINMKGHPLAEQGRSYGGDANAPQYKKSRPVSINTAIVAKSVFSGLPETDHRMIGERLDLFSFQEVSPGMVYWHRNGLVVFRQVMEFIREMEGRYGYEEISTPTLANVALWHVSGHIDHYRKEMFMFSSENENLGMKPMNCPSSILVYKSRKWSYRELPFRTAIFDRLYRNEISGALTGLFRVRELTQDDGHIFLKEDQVKEEMRSLLRMVKEVYDTFGMKFTAKLSTMPDDHMGDEELWDKAIDALRSGLESNGMKYEIKEKDGAFYGPKIDFDVIDSIGRQWQCATIQLDYQLPIRFGLEYTGDDGKSHSPVIIHRAILGSLERFIGVLIEHYQGKFPAWLAPTQARVISISEPVNEYAAKVLEKLRAAGIRAEGDLSGRTLEYKIRDAQVQKVPYMIIIGKKEQDGNAITVRRRDSRQQEYGVNPDSFIERLSKEIRDRSLQG